MLTSLVTSTVIAYHGTGGGDASPMLLVVFLGVVATAGWLLFSNLSWRMTVTVTVVGWVLLLTSGFVF